jgi:hypothetical protein
MWIDDVDLSVDTRGGVKERVNRADKIEEECTEGGNNKRCRQFPISYKLL